MTETQKRIRAYKRALPHMRERVIAVALLLAMSISMLGSASFAWITLSRSPEVSSLATTIATNGNLEIALSDKDGLEPDETAIGDGGQAVTLSNLTWGNLVNLSDQSYGLDKLTLRPAILNSGSLLDSPLYSVEYGSDGRITELVSDFAFTNYGTKDGAKAFFVPDETQYGVRAISSVTYSSVTGDTILIGLSNDIARNQGVAKQKFQALYGNKSYMSSIASLAGVYLSYRIEDVDQDCTGYVEVAYKMMDEYEDVLLKVGDTLLAMANLHHFVYCNKNNKTYTAFTLEQLNNGTAQTILAEEGITLSAMSMYLSDYEIFYINANTAGITGGLWSSFQTNVYEPWKKNKEIGWELLRKYINVFTDINSATINGTAASELDATKMAGLAIGQKVCVLTNGLIKNMDQMLGTELSLKNVEMHNVPIVGNITVNEIKTSASDGTHTYYLVEDVKAAERKAAAGGLDATDAVAADTYGMAIDLWVRTNASNSLLMLEGELEYETVYLMDEEGNPLTDDNGNPITETKVKGYSGKNRVWEEDDPNLPILGTSVTQGSGSCYIFYPESPEDQAQALEMLRAMCVAFVAVEQTEIVQEVENPDGTVTTETVEVPEGKLLAQADLDVDNAIESGGRVLVPLQLRAKSIEVEDEEGNLVTQNSYHITELEQNVATQITAIVYMDGSRLSNSQVLSSGSINGQLNIQFGTTEDIVSIDNPDLKEEYYNIIISVADAELTYDPNNLPRTTVTLILNGMEAKEVQANFVSYISETQGARQPAFTFTNTPGTNEWVGEVTFNGPGSYHLRSVQIDGVDYVLTEEQIQSTVVYVPGIGINSVSCTGWDGQNSYYYMTADSYYQLEMQMGLNIGEGMSAPRSVQGVFAHEDGQNVTVNFTQTNDGWVAKTNFTTSGTYTMTYAIIDGTYEALSTAQQKTLTLNLGMQARIFITQPVTQDYLDELDALNTAEDAEIAEVNADNTLSDEAKETAIAEIETRYDAQRAALLAALNGEDGLKMTSSANGYQFEYDGSEPLFMDVSVIITDDQNNVMTDLSNVVLHYGIGQSVANRLDANLTLNSSNNRYEGDFQLTRPGTYTFQNLEMSAGTIYSVSNAPRIAAIAKDPISYLGKAWDYQTEVTNISSTATRYMSVDLADSPSAQVKLVLQHTELDENGNKVLDANGKDTYTYTIEEMATPIDNLDGTYTYMVNVPTDGTWEITNMYVSQAYYDGVYYDGAEGEGATGWLDLSEQVQADNIVTTFFTTVNFSIKNQPSSNQFDGEFMEDHVVEDLTVMLTDYLGNAIEGADVSLSYTWNPGTLGANFTKVSGTPSNTTFSSVTTADGKNFVMEDMNFQLDGQYVGSFAITIDGTEYSQTDFTRADDTTVYTDYYVYWDQPEVEITGVSPDTAIEVNAGGNDNKVYLDTSYYYDSNYASVYFYVSGELAGNTQYYVPEVQLELTDGKGKASEGTLTAANSSGNESNYTLNASNSWTSSQEIGYTETLRGQRRGAGEYTISTINLSDGTSVFSLKLKKAIEIDLSNAPPYVSFNSTSTDGVALKTTPDKIAGTMNSNHEFEVKLPASQTWTVDMESTVDGEFAEVDSTTKDVYTKTNQQWGTVGSGCDTSIVEYWDYVKYTETKKTYQAVSTLTTWTNTYTITGWNVNGTVYDPGDTIKITGNVTITAEVDVMEGTKTPDDTTATYYTYTYTQTASATKQSSVPSGYGTEVSSATDYTTETTYS